MTTPTDSRKDGGAAFPRPYSANLYGEFVGQEGMTLRDYFAAKAMQALIQKDLPPMHGMDSVEVTAFAAYEIADAMLAARSKP